MSMFYKSYSKLNDVIQKTPLLIELQDKLSYISELNHAVKKLLNNELSQNCTVANYRDNILILSTSSPVWKHQLRFYQADILTHLRQIPKFAGIIAIEIIIDPETSKKVSNPRKKLNVKISEDSINSVMYLSEGLDSESAPKLKKALVNLFNRIKKFTKTSSKAP